MERNKYFWIAAAWSILVVIACLIEGNYISKVPVYDIPNKDKIAHFIFYFVFSILWCKYLLSKNKTKSIKYYFMVFMYAAMFGGTVEIMQYYFTESRAAEWSDFIANCTGSFIGLLILYLFSSKK